MEILEDTYEKSELLKVAEKIYETKGRIQDLNLTLEDEKFHEKYISKRKTLAYTQSTTRIFSIILLSVAILISLGIFIFCMSSKEPILGILMGVAGGVAISCAYVDIKLIRQQIEIFPLLHYNLDDAKALRFSRKKDVVTYQSDEITTKKKIELLQEEIQKLSGTLEELENKQQRLLSEKNKKERFLKEKEILFEPEDLSEEAKNHQLGDGKLSLKKRDTYSDDIQELFELYANEEKYVSHYLSRLKVQLDSINREIMSIDDNYDTAKKKIFIAVIIFIFLIVLQSAFSGDTAKFFSLCFSVISILGIFYLDNTCSRPILFYYIEHEHKWAREYAFVNSVVPVKYKRQELLEVIKRNEKELQEIKEKKDALDRDEDEKEEK